MLRAFLLLNQRYFVATLTQTYRTAIFFENHLLIINELQLLLIRFFTSFATSVRHFTHFIEQILCQTLQIFLQNFLHVFCTFLRNILLVYLNKSFIVSSLLTILE